METINFGNETKHHYALHCGHYWLKDWAFSTKPMGREHPHGMSRSIRIDTDPDMARIVYMSLDEVKALVALLNLGTPLKKGYTSAGHRAVLARTYSDLTTHDEDTPTDYRFDDDYDETRSPVEYCRVGFSEDYGRPHPAGDVPHQRWVVRRQFVEGSDDRHEYVSNVRGNDVSSEHEMWPMWTLHPEDAITFPRAGAALEFANRLMGVHRIDAVQRVQ